MTARPSFRLGAEKFRSFHKLRTKAERFSEGNVVEFPAMSGYSSPKGSLPLGVAVIAILIGIFAFLLLLVGFVVLTFSTFGAGLEGFEIFGAGVVGGLLVILVAVLLFVVAYGLWNQELWALALSIIVVGVLWLSDVFGGRIFSLGALVLLVLLVYLILVHRHFT